MTPEDSGASPVDQSLTDTERIDFLESLMTRTEYQNKARPTESVGSDIHMHSRRCSLYVRNLFGNVVASGESDSVRDTIDAVASALRPKHL